jgi:hypothetical protein
MWQVEASSHGFDPCCCGGNRRTGAIPNCGGSVCLSDMLLPGEQGVHGILDLRVLFSTTKDSPAHDQVTTCLTQTPLEAAPFLTYHGHLLDSRGVVQGACHDHEGLVSDGQRLRVHSLSIEGETFWRETEGE